MPYILFHHLLDTQPTNCVSQVSAETHQLPLNVTKNLPSNRQKAVLQRKRRSQAWRLIPPKRLKQFFRSTQLDVGRKDKAFKRFWCIYFVQRKWHLSRKKSQRKKQCSKPYVFAGVDSPNFKWRSLIPRNDHLWVQTRSLWRPYRGNTIFVWDDQAVCFQLLVLRLSASVGWLNKSSKHIIPNGVFVMTLSTYVNPSTWHEPWNPGPLIRILLFHGLWKHPYSIGSISPLCTLNIPSLNNGLTHDHSIANRPTISYMGVS